MSPDLMDEERNKGIKVRDSKLTFGDLSEARKILARRGIKMSSGDVHRYVDKNPHAYDAIITGRSFYETNKGSHSFFRDMLEGNRDFRADNRLKSVYLSENRDLTTGGWTPSAPRPIADAFQTSARARGPLAAAIGSKPLPDNGALSISAPRFGTSASAAVQGELAAVSETDPTTALNTSNIALVAGQVDVSIQMFDLSYPDIDKAIAAELGEAIALAIDGQIINGTGVAPQTTGLLNVTGAQANTWTDVSPTVAEAQAEVWKLYSAMALKSQPSLVIMHPRRYAWMSSGADTSGNPIVPRFPGEVVASAGVPVTLGAGVNEDAVIVVDRDKTLLYRSQPQFSVKAQPGSGNGVMRCQAYCYVALLPTAKAVGKVTGTGLIAPAGY